MDPSFIMAGACAIIGVAACILTLWWLGDSPPQQQPAHPMDREPHTITVLGRDGRPNPLHYERLPNYAAARARQRDLIRQGKDSIIAHADSGQIRLDLSAWFGLYGRIGL